MIKSVFISGAAGNLGKAVCRKFLKEDWKVVAAVGPSDDLKFISHQNLKAFKIDLSDEPKTEKLLEEISDNQGPFSMAIFTVGGFSMGRFTETGLGDIRKMFQLNFETAYTSARIFFQHFLKAKMKGRMILIGARPGLNLNLASDMVAYGLSKSLVIGLSEIINASGQESGVDAAVIIPSIIDTPANRRAMPGADFNKWVKPEYLAENVYFLSTPAGWQQRAVIFKLYGDS
ncbi:MAG: SDR family NAD(P)-dependent oxidoreductase [Cyclobacteriaceae bacterium]|nr:SDR family NAD(P)-dependent oxidoreductase [Cyclobacteriaceae bacterium]